MTKGKRLKKKATKKKATPAKPRRAAKKIDPTYQLIRGLTGSLQSRVEQVEQKVERHHAEIGALDDALKALVARVEALEAARATAEELEGFEQAGEKAP